MNVMIASWRWLLLVAVLIGVVVALLVWRLGPVDSACPDGQAEPWVVCEGL
jgi:hypothetical protein